MFQCPQAKGDRREGGKDVLGKLRAGKPLLMCLRFTVLGLMPLKKQRCDFSFYAPRNPMDGGKKLSSKESQEGKAVL